MSQSRTIQIEQDVLSENDRHAMRNRQSFESHRVLALNLVSSPGSGKTTLLCATLEALRARHPHLPLAVIEGDQQTSNDAERIRATGVPAIQVNTGKGCHLDARMVADAYARLPLHEAVHAHGHGHAAPLAPPAGGLGASTLRPVNPRTPAGILFIENVGNLVCPALWDLGEAAKVAILSVTEGEDKPLKYPDMFAAAGLMLLTKTDLLPHLDFDVQRCLEYAQRVNPGLRVIQLSARDGSGMSAWLDWLLGDTHDADARAAPPWKLNWLDSRPAMTELRIQTLPDAAIWPPVLACGAWLKNSACLLQRDQVIWSPVHGDLDETDNCVALENSLEHLLSRAEGTPRTIAHDLHPDFHSTRLAVEIATRLGVQALGVQHHHAHIASLQAEHGLPGPVLGLALDGVGLGSDGNAWGGELLRVDHAAWRRLGALLPLPLPGGDVAAREPWRLVAAALQLLGRGDEIAPRLAPLVGDSAAATVARMLDRRLNCPPSSGAGRWFDAAAGILGLSLRQTFEAEAAIALEQHATQYLAQHAAPSIDGLWQLHDDGRLDLLPLLTRLFQLADQGHSSEGAAVFHVALAAALADWVARQPAELPVLLGGGCFANRLLSAHLSEHLSRQGRRVFCAQTVSCGDAGLALGQAWIAAQWADPACQAALPLEDIPPCA